MLKEVCLGSSVSSFLLNQKLYVTLRDRSVEAELSTWVIILLQALKTALTPAISSIPSLSSLITISVVDISVKALLSAGLVQDVTDLVAELGCHGIGGSAGGFVGEEGSDEEVILTVGESSGVGAESLDSLHGVALEHEEGVGEGSAGGGGGVLEELVHGGLSGGVVRLEVDWETGIGVSGLAAWSICERDSGPGSQITVVSWGVGVNDWSEGFEGGGVSGADNVDAFLDEVECDDGLRKY
ncbi:MAG: hypothetical protein CL912_13120 [Deltaproteobacteria bacterium]|nr:hypothetical protein [Deltaproteobacteria bacterium]